MIEATTSSRQADNAYVPPTGLSDRISSEYLEAQRALHELPAYGVNSVRWVEFIEDLIKQHGFRTVLDYGCGKGMLKSGLEHVAVEIREYDPAIPGKDAEPEPADLVVCMDVLEHIEPDKLPSVLEHLRCLGNRLFVTISTQPALKTLPDGRNAHLSLHDADWWHHELGMRWEIIDWQVRNHREAVGFLKPYILIGEIKSFGAVEDDTRNANVRVNVEVTKQRLRPAKFVRWTAPAGVYPMMGVRPAVDDGDCNWLIPQPHNGVAILMCYGPSLADTWQDAVEDRKNIENSVIVSVSGAHDWLIDRGVIPDYHVECDPREHKGDMIQKPDKRVEYLMASCCHPNVVAKLKDYNLRLWHLYNGKASREIYDIEPSALIITGGGSVGLRSMPLFYTMGYRRFIIHGMDCSYRGDDTHAGHHTGKKVNRVEVRCADGRTFITAPVLVTYKRFFDELRKSHVGDVTTDPSKIELIVSGDGLLQHWLQLLGGALSPDQIEASTQETL